MPTSGDNLIARADGALYISKESGRDRITLAPAPGSVRKAG
ncbi:MAG: hypothetical protein QM770_00690 [Tepidisphaeraceae bacterium]